MARSEGAALIGVNWLASKRQRLPSLTQTSRFTRIGVAAIRFEERAVREQIQAALVYSKRIICTRKMCV